jgi:hypothetical protein
MSIYLTFDNVKIPFLDKDTYYKAASPVGDFVLVEMYHQDKEIGTIYYGNAPDFPQERDKVKRTEKKEKKDRVIFVKGIEKERLIQTGKSWPSCIHIMHQSADPKIIQLVLSAIQGSVKK